MKIIEALKQINANKIKIEDLQKKINTNCANLSYETPQYGDKTSDQIKEWLQACTDISKDNVQLLTRIAKTNLATKVTLTLGDKSVEKTIAEWIWRRREYAAIDLKTWSQLTDRGLREGVTPSTTGGEPMKITIVRHFEPKERDTKLAIYASERHTIDSALEVANATTDLLEL